MKLLDRYIARELVAPFLFGVGAFTSIFIASQLFFKLTSWIAKGAPALDIGVLFVMRLVPMMIFTFPMAMLLAVLLAYGRLSGECELIAMLASGIPFLRTAVPALAMGVVVSGLGLAITEKVVPAAGRTGERLERRILDRLRADGADVGPPSANRAFVVQDTDPDGQLARVVVARSVDLASRSMRDVTLVEYGLGKNGIREVKALLEAKRAVWEKNEGWEFFDARLQLVNASPQASAGVDDSSVTRFSTQQKSIRWKLRRDPRQVIAQQRSADEMNFAELRAYLVTLRDQGARLKAVRSLEVELHNKLSIPFASMVFALIGAPLGLRRLRGGASVGLGLSVLIIFGYYIVYHGMHVLGEGGQIPPIVAGWLPNAVGAVAGLVLIKRAPT